MARSGIIPQHGIDEALTAAEAAADIGDAWRRPAAPPVLAAPDLTEEPRLLSEACAKAELAQIGVAVPAGIQASDARQAAMLAGTIGFPVVLKASGPAHKSDYGGVRTNLESSEAVEAAARGMGNASTFLIEAQIEAPVAELLIGIVREPGQGFLLTIGHGGITAEIMRDSRSLLLPTCAEEIRGALGRLRIWPVLAGHRGQKGANMDAIVATILAVSAYAEANSHRLQELEINPYLATADTGYAADALLRMTDQRERDS